MKVTISRIMMNIILNITWIILITLNITLKMAISGNGGTNTRIVKINYKNSDFDCFNSHARGWSL